MAKPRIEDRNKVLVVEGYSDLHFYDALLDHLNKPDQVFIQPMNGKQDLILNLETFLSPDLLKSKESIGVIVDADADAAATTKGLAAALRRITNVDVVDGQWVSVHPRIGFFVTPGSGNPGEVETLAWQAWSNFPSNQSAKQCIDTYVDCMARSGVKAKSPDKGRIGSLLALRADEDPRLGPGARQNVFDFNWPEFNPLTQFLSQI